MAEEKKKDELNYQFVSLVFSLQQAAMAQLGKITNPATGKMEKNLIQAKATIDMLEMLKEKSESNLTDTEQKIILNTLDNLYLNYADEVATAEAAEKPKEEKKPSSASPSAKATADKKATEGKPRPSERSESKEEKKE